MSFKFLFPSSNVRFASHLGVIYLFMFPAWLASGEVNVQAWQECHVLLEMISKVKNCFYDTSSRVTAKTTVGDVSRPV